MIDHAGNYSTPYSPADRGCRPPYSRLGTSKDNGPESLRSGRLAVIAALFVLTAQAVAQSGMGGGGYGGPSMLSRGGNSPGRRGQAPVDFNFYAGIRVLAEQGLIAPRLVDDNLDPVTAYGGSVEAGVYGGRDWRNDSIGVDYRGDYRRHSLDFGFDGFNQALAVQYQHTFNRRTAVQFVEVGGTSNRAFGGFSAPAFAEVGRYGVPLNEVYDVRTYYSQTSVGVSRRQSARMAFGAMVSGFFVKRQNFSLINSQGYAAAGGLSYVMSRRTNLSLSYQFVHFEYPRIYGDSQASSVTAGLSRRFGRSWMLSAGGGLMRVNTKATEQVTLSPEVAYILGVTTGVRAFNRTEYVPNVNVEAAFTQARGRAFISYTDTIGAGNGVYTTTSARAVRAGYSFAGLRRVSIALSAGYTHQKSLTQTLGGFDSYQAGAGVGYKIIEHLDFTSQVDYRIFNAPGLRGRDGVSAMIGLSYTPSRFPISIW